MIRIPEPMEMPDGTCTTKPLRGHLTQLRLCRLSGGGDPIAKRDEILDLVEAHRVMMLARFG